jgi:PAS domain S-box-containing protein
MRKEIPAGQEGRSVRVSEARYRRLFEMCHDGILIVDAETGEIEDLNPQLVTMLGYGYEDLRGRKLWETEAFRDAESAKAAFHLLQDEECLRHDDLPLETKGGGHIDVEFVCNVYGIDGQRVIQCNIRDVTAKKEAERLIRENEQRYRALLDNAGDAIVIADPGGKIIEVNKQAEILLGYAEDELLGMSVRDLHPAEELEKVLHDFGATAEGKAIPHTDTTVVRKDGALVPVDIRGTRITFDGQTVLQGIFRDTTERRQAEDLLKKTSNDLRALIEAMSDVVMVIDRKGRCIEVVPTGATRRYKYVNELIGKSFKDMFPSETAKRLLASLKMALANGRTVNVEASLEVGGKTLWFANAISPRTPESALLVGRDITGLKKAAAELETQSAALQETNAALKVLIKNMEEARQELEDTIASNIKTLVLPYINKIRRLQPGDPQKPYLDILETNLAKIVSPFLHRLNQYNLTPAEIRVANLIRDGRTTKEIMELLHSSKGAIDIHRYNIRKKLGINKEKANFRSYLLSLNR